MKNKLCARVFGLLIPFVMATTVYANPIAHLTASDSYIMAGESFTVDVTLVVDQDYGDLVFYGFDVDSLSSLTLFSYNGYAVSGAYDDFGDNSNIVVGAIKIDPPEHNAGQDITLATLSLTAGPDSGTDTLSISGLYADADHGALFAYYDPDDINAGTDGFVRPNFNINGSLDLTIHDAAPIPEPATMLLLGTGLAGLVGGSRRRKVTV